MIYSTHLLLEVSPGFDCPCRFLIICEVMVKCASFPPEIEASVESALTFGLHFSYGLSHCRVPLFSPSLVPTTILNPY